MTGVRLAIASVAAVLAGVLQAGCKRDDAPGADSAVSVTTLQSTSVPRARPPAPEPTLRPPELPRAEVPVTVARGAYKGGRMVAIPGGSFSMGSDDGGSREKPVHQVSVASFELDATEVTVDAYKTCVDAKRCTTTGLNKDSDCNWANAGRGDHPINCIDWEQATAFCAWAGKRLPTEEEWEYAARKGPEGRIWPWGSDAPDKQLCWSKTSGGHTCRVGSYASARDPWGLKDMAGDVAEWTASAYSNDYGSARSDSQRVVRGESWFGGESFGWNSAREGSAPTDRYGIVGVRCASDSR